MFRPTCLSLKRLKLFKTVSYMIVLKFSEISSYFKSLPEIFLTMISKICSVTLVIFTFLKCLSNKSTDDFVTNSF